MGLDYGGDIVSQLKDFLENNKIRCGFINGIGAIKNAEIGYYDQKSKEYIKRRFDERAEILSLTGNVSLHDGEIFPHLHVILGYNNRIYGGHLFGGEVFACEVFVIELEGNPPRREKDPQTGLNLW